VRGKCHRSHFFGRDIKKREELIRINSCDWMEELPGWWIGQDHRAGHVDVVLLGRADMTNPQRSFRRPWDKNDQLQSHW
jgi:hypothetical protein